MRQEKEGVLSSWPQFSHQRQTCLKISRRASREATGVRILQNCSVDEQDSDLECLSPAPEVDLPGERKPAENNNDSDLCLPPPMVSEREESFFGWSPDS